MTNDEKIMQWLRPYAIVPVDMDTTRILIEALRARLAQPKQKNDGYCQACEGDYCTAKSGCVALSNPPPKREWVGLTNEDRNKLHHLIDWTVPLDIKKFSDSVEAMLKEKNT